jgi:hypothetical protein
VTASTPVALTASFGGASRNATLTVNPAGGGTGALPAPSLVSPQHDARFNSGQTIVFDWSDVSGAASYIIQIDEQDSFSSPIVNQTVTASTYSRALPTTRMWWRVRAVNASGTPGAWSSVRRFELR